MANYTLNVSCYSIEPENYYSGCYWVVNSCTDDKAKSSHLSWG